MKSRTTPNLFICLAVCLAVFACRFSPVNVAESGQPPENQGIGNPVTALFSGVTNLFVKPNDRVNIGGIEPQGYSLEGQLGGSTVTVAVKGDTAFIGQGPRIVALDISNPESPEFLGESPVLPGLVMGLEIIDHYIYAAVMYSGLHILDISQPGVIKPVSEVEPKVPGCDAVTIEGRFAYLACNPAGLFIADISNPKKPGVIFQETKSPGVAFSLALINQRIYIVNTSGQSLDVYDVSVPSQAKKTGAFPFSGLPSGTRGAASLASVRPCGTFLCAAAEQDGLVIFDVSEPEQPVIAAHFDTQVASGLVVDSNTVYLADDMEGIQIIDISNPEAPVLLGTLPTTVGGWEFSVKEHGERGLVLAGSRLYITDPAYGLTISDVSAQDSPVRLGGYMTPLPDVLSDIRVAGNTAYVTGRNSGFRTVDISDPKHSRELFYDDSRKNLYTQNPSGLVIRDNLAYIADKNYPLHIYDVSDSAKPVETGALFDHAASDGAIDLALNGNLAYLSGWGGKDAFYPGKGLWVVDISNTAQPEAVNFVDVANEDWILALAKGHLFALDTSMDRDSGGQKEPIALRVFDLSDPEKPVEVKTIPIPEAMNLSPVDMTSDGELLFVHLLPASILVFDLTEPDDPIKTSTLPLMGGMPDILKEGKLLYLGGTTVYDISNIKKPEFFGTLGNLQAWDVTVEKNLVYVITTFQGMYIFRPER